MKAKNIGGHALYVCQENDVKPVTQAGDIVPDRLYVALPYRESLEKPKPPKLAGVPQQGWLYQIDRLSRVSLLATAKDAVTSSVHQERVSCDELLRMLQELVPGGIRAYARECLYRLDVEANEHLQNWGPSGENFDVWEEESWSLCEKYLPWVGAPYMEAARRVRESVALIKMSRVCGVEPEKMKKMLCQGSPQLATRPVAGKFCAVLYGARTPTETLTKQFLEVHRTSEQVQGRIFQVGLWGCWGLLVNQGRFKVVEGVPQVPNFSATEKMFVTYETLLSESSWSSTALELKFEVHSFHQTSQDARAEAQKLGVFDKGITKEATLPGGAKTKAQILAQLETTPVYQLENVPLPYGGSLLADTVKVPLRIYGTVADIPIAVSDLLGKNRGFVGELSICDDPVLKELNDLVTPTFEMSALPFTHPGAHRPQTTL